jgi:hypothetical protein
LLFLYSTIKNPLRQADTRGFTYLFPYFFYKNVAIINIIIVAQKNVANVVCIIYPF